MTDQQMKALETRIEIFLGTHLPNGVESSNEGIQISDRQWDLIKAEKLYPEEGCTTDQFEDAISLANEEFEDLAKRLSALTGISWEVVIDQAGMVDDSGETHYPPIGLEADID